MTIPIIPGPLSFLPKAAEAFKSYVEAKDFVRRRQLQDRMNNVDMLLKLNAQGIVRPSVFGTDEFIGLLRDIGTELNPSDVRTYDPRDDILALTQSQLGKIAAEPGIEGETGRAIVTGTPTPQQRAEGATGTAVARGRGEILETGKAPPSGAAAEVLGVKPQTAQATGTVTDIQPLAERVARAVRVRMGNKFYEKGELGGAVSKEAIDTAWQESVASAQSLGIPPLDEKVHRIIIEAELLSISFDEQEKELNRLRALAYSAGYGGDENVKALQAAQAYFNEVNDVLQKFQVDNPLTQDNNFQSVMDKITYDKLVTKYADVARNLFRKSPDQLSPAEDEKVLLSFSEQEKALWMKMQAYNAELDRLQIRAKAADARVLELQARVGGPLPGQSVPAPRTIDEASDGMLGTMVADLAQNPEYDNLAKMLQHIDEISRSAEMPMRPQTVERMKRVATLYFSGVRPQ
jgi:hypothetical protein